MQSLKSKMPIMTGCSLKLAPDKKHRAANHSRLRALRKTRTQSTHLGSQGGAIQGVDSNVNLGHEGAVANLLAAVQHGSLCAWDAVMHAIDSVLCASWSVYECSSKLSTPSTVQRTCLFQLLK